MENFLLIVKRNSFVVYRQTQNYELQYINGEASLYYDSKKVALYLQQIVTALVDEFNLASAQELSLTLVLGFDKLTNEEVTKYLLAQQCLVTGETLSLQVLLVRLYNSLAPKVDLMIKEYGINYDGLNYQKTAQQNLKKHDFKLLAYRVTDSDVIAVLQVGVQ